MKWNRTTNILPEAGQSVLAAIDDFDGNVDIVMAFVDTNGEWYDYSDRFFLASDPYYWAEIPTKEDIEASLDK